MGIKVKRNGAWVDIPTGGTKVYTQDEEPTTAKAGDLWCTEEEGDSIEQVCYDNAHPVNSTIILHNDETLPAPDGISATWELVESSELVKKIDLIEFDATKSITSGTYTVPDLSNVRRIYVEFMGYGGWVQTQSCDLELLKAAGSGAGFLFSICWQTIGNNSYGSLEYKSDTSIAVGNITNVTVRGVYGEEVTPIKIYKRTA